MSVITQDGASALMEAAYRGETEVVVELVKARALLHLQNIVCFYTYNYTRLMYRNMHTLLCILKLSLTIHV